MNPLKHLQPAQLSSGCLVTSIISPRAGKGDPDCPKTKLTFRPHRREYFPAFYASRCARVIHSWIPEGVAGRWVLSLNNLGLPSLHGDLLYTSPGTPSSAPFWTVQLVILTVTSRHFSRLTYKFYGAWWPRARSSLGYIFVRKKLHGFITEKEKMWNVLRQSFLNCIVRSSNSLGHLVIYKRNMVNRLEISW